MATTGEKVNQAVTYGLLFKEVFEALIKNPKVQESTLREIIKISKGGRGRGDEMVFFASLFSYQGAEVEDKLLFLDKHYELLNPDLNVTDPTKAKVLKKKKALAKGLIFLISEDRSCNVSDSSKLSTDIMFKMAHEVWGAVFMGVKAMTNAAKLQHFEKRILHFGKNHQEGKTLKQFALATPEKIQSTWQSIKSFDSSLAEKIPDVPADPGLIKGVFGNVNPLNIFRRKRSL